MTSLENLFNPKPEPPEKILVIHCSYMGRADDEKILYRYQGHSSHYEGGGVEHRIYLNTYPIFRETEKTYFIYDYDKVRRVLKDARKRFAYPTKELAWNSFKHRLSWRISRLTSQLDDARSIKEEYKKIGQTFLDYEA